MAIFWLLAALFGVCLFCLILLLFFEVRDANAVARLSPEQRQFLAQMRAAEEECLDGWRKLGRDEVEAIAEEASRRISDQTPGGL